MSNDPNQQQQNMFMNMHPQPHPLSYTEDTEDDMTPRESPFMGNHIVKTVRNLKRVK